MNLFENISAQIGALFSGLSDTMLSGVNMVIRFMLPVLVVIILIRCAKSLFSDSNEVEIWGYLAMPGGSRIKLNHWENIIGRSKSSDIIFDYPIVSRTHAAIARDNKGVWTVTDLNSKGGTFINGEQIYGSAVIKKGDVLSLGGVQLVFMPISPEDERIQAERRTRPGREIRPAVTLMYITVVQLLLTLQLMIADNGEYTMMILLSFAMLCVIMWTSYIFTRVMRRVAFEVESIAFLLCTVGLEVTATSVPSDLMKQIILLLAGVILYFIVCFFMRDLRSAKKLRYVAAVGGALLLCVNLVLSEAVFGAKNWLEIGGFSFQPSEFVKIAFVLAGAATVDRIFAKRNIILYIAFSGFCVGALALMSDFGTAVVFFVAYLVTAFLRSGNFATIFLSVGGAGFAGFLALTVKPYIKARFATWGKAWEFPHDGGYQQTRTMSAAASGGLFGVGAGSGWLHEITAANTDMVFGMVCEELGLIVAISLAAGIVILAVFSVRSAGTARSSFYVIAACAASSVLLIQLILNAMGCVDILPFTGVTFPFVSKGGSSLISCWGLLAFIKAADTRQNASISIRMPSRKIKTEMYEPDLDETVMHAPESYSGNSDIHHYSDDYYVYDNDDDDYTIDDDIFYGKDNDTEE